MDIAEFRSLTQRVMDAEKPGFWSDWTPDQQALYMSGDWKAFSRSRGYTEDQIAECDQWLKVIHEDRAMLEHVQDIVANKALMSLAADTKGEILMSSRPPEYIRGAMMALESKIKSHPEGKGPDDFPLKHTFVDGLYIRESFMPEGILFTTKIHKVDHAMFIMSGDVSILTEDGFKRVKAPFNGITKRGTKRVVLTHADTVCITVHPTSCQDVTSVEKELFASSFDEVGLSCLEKESLCQL